jgi:hypothetical protein
MDWISRNKQTEQVQYMLKNEVLLGGKDRQLLIFRSLMQTVITWNVLLGGKGRQFLVSLHQFNLNM